MEVAFEAQEFPAAKSYQPAVPYLPLLPQTRERICKPFAAGDLYWVVAGWCEVAPLGLCLLDQMHNPTRAPDPTDLSQAQLAIRSCAYVHPLVSIVAYRYASPAAGSRREAQAPAGGSQLQDVATC